MKLSIIIVSWNTCELTLKCLESIFKYLKNIEYQVFLVDNNSSDDTVKYASKLNYSNLKIIANKQNLGFAAANNLAIKQAQGEYILLLNPDTELTCHPVLDTGSRGKKDKLDSGFRRDDKSGIGSMTEFIEQHSDCGIVGPKLLNTNKTLQRSCRQFPKLLDQLFIQLKFYNFFPNKIKATREYFMLDFNHDSIYEVDQVMGAALLTTRKVINKIGLLDEKFFATFEEVDFCKRAKNAGYKIYFYPEVQIIHHKESSFNQMANLRKQINFNHSLYYYFKKHKPAWQLFILWLIQPINLLLTLLDMLFGIRKKAGKQKDL